jgi:hypothetical protein
MEAGMNRKRTFSITLLSLVIIFSLAASSECYGQAPPLPAEDNYVDLGNPEDERFHDLRGWRGMNAVLPKGFGVDRTSRYQSLRGSNSVKLFVSQLGTPHRLMFRSEAGICDDSFEVYVNNAGPLYIYKNKEAAQLKSFHQLTVDAPLITSTIVEVTFKNIAEDSCGKAAIGFVALEPAGENAAPQTARLEAPQVNLQRAIEVVELYAAQEKLDLSAYTLTDAHLVTMRAGERGWELRWGKINGKPEDDLEFTVSMEGRLSSRPSR